MKKRVMGLLLSACLIITMMPAVAFAGQSEAPVELGTVGERVVNQVRDGAPTDAAHEALPAEKAAAEPAAEPLEKQGFAAPNKAKTAKASDASASVNGVTYDNLYEAVEMAPAGATVKVLQSLNLDEMLIIDKKLTLDLGGNYLVTDSDFTVITVQNANVTIKNGSVHVYYDTDNLTTACVYACGNSTVLMEDVYLNTVRPYASGVMVDVGSKVTMNECEHTNSLDDVYTSLVPDITTVQDYNIGAYIGEGGTLEMNECIFEEFSCSYGVWAIGDAEINDCYIVQTYDPTSTTEAYGIAILAMEDANVTVDDGYYYGENPVWINDYAATVKVLEGWFVSYWLEDPVFAGATDGLVIPSGYRANEKNWESLGDVDELWVYKDAAPTTVTSNLTSYYGQNAGYDDIKVTWSKVSGVDGYKVYYKKSTSSSYTLLKTVAYGKTRSAIKSNLTDGAKYYMKVVPYVKIADKVLSSEDAKTVTCSKYKTDYTYTLKKLSKPTVSKSGTKVKVKWTNISGETGYQISKSTSKSKTGTITTYKTTSGTYKTLSATKGKTYYYKVRAYRIVDGKYIYGPWSDVRAYKR